MEDKIIEKLIAIEQKVDGMVTREEFDDFRGAIIQNHEEVVGLIKRLDEERTFGTARVDRLEEDVVKIKAQLKMA